MTIKNMHNSEGLQDGVFQGPPTSNELQKKIESMIAQLYPQKKASPEVLEALDNVRLIAGKVESLAWETRNKILELYVETRMNAYQNDVAALELKQSNSVWNILSGNTIAVLQDQQSRRTVRASAANDSSMSQSA